MPWLRELFGNQLHRRGLSLLLVLRPRTDLRSGVQCPVDVGSLSSCSIGVHSNKGVEHRVEEFNTFKRGVVTSVALNSRDLMRRTNSSTVIDRKSGTVMLPHGQVSVG